MRNHVHAVDLDHGLSRGSQRGVQDRSILGGVDLHAGEHSFGSLSQAAGVREFDQHSDGLGGQSVLREIEEQSGAFR